MNCSIYFCAINSKAKEVDADYREMFIHLKNKRRLLFYTTSLTVYHKNTMVYYIYKQEKQKYVFFLGFNGVIDTDINKIFSFFEELQKVFNIHAKKGTLPEEKFFAIQQELLNDWAIHKITNHTFTECYSPTYTSIENSPSETSFDDIAKDKLVSRDIVEAIKQYSLVYVYISELKFNWYDWVFDWDDIFSVACIAGICIIIVILLVFIGALIYQTGWSWGYIFLIGGLASFYIVFGYIGCIIGVAIGGVFYGLNYIASAVIYILNKLLYTKNFIDSKYYNNINLIYKNLHNIKEAQYNLGMCYLNGEGVTKDKEQAVYWYTKAAEQGNVDAQKKLGFCYEYGFGVEIDLQKANYWYDKANKNKFV